MDTKEKIKVLLIENSKSAIGDMKRAFENNDTYELISKRESARDSNIMEPTRARQKEKLLELLEPINYQILIFDLLLRDKTEIEPELLREDFCGCDKILSLEVARELKQRDEFADIMVLFTSSSLACSTHGCFERMREAFPDLIPKEFYFIFKPEREGHESLLTGCPAYREDNVGECGKPGGIKECKCTRDECFMAVLDKYYMDFRKERECEELYK